VGFAYARGLELLTAEGLLVSGAQVLRLATPRGGGHGLQAATLLELAARDRVVLEPGH
jgi:hypothetical protein